MSTHDLDPRREGPLTPFSQNLMVLASIAVLTAEVVQFSGIAGSVARWFPVWPSLEAVAIVVVPIAYLCSIAFRGMGRWVAEISRQYPLALAALPLAVVGVGSMVFQRAEGPRSPIRSSQAVSYYNIPGDASELEAHRTLPPGTAVAGGTRQRKIFRLRNAGVVDWVSRWLCRSDELGMNSRDNLTTPECVRIPNTPAGESVDVEVDVTVGNRAGTLVALLKMSDGKGAWYYSATPPVRIELQVSPAMGR